MIGSDPDPVEIDHWTVPECDDVMKNYLDVDNQLRIGRIRGRIEPQVHGDVSAFLRFRFQRSALDFQGEKKPKKSLLIIIRATKFRLFKKKSKFQQTFKKQLKFVVFQFLSKFWIFWVKFWILLGQKKSKFWISLGQKKVKISIFKVKKWLP